MAYFVSSTGSPQTLKPQDVVVLLKLVAADNENPSYSRLANDLHMSPSEVHGALARAETAGFGQFIASTLGPRKRKHVNRANLREFLVHGIKYAFPPARGGETRGFPTGYAAPVFSGKFQPDFLPPVWPDPEGPARGLAFSPLWKSVPKAIRGDRELYDLLALVDAIRGGRAREREKAVDELTKRLGRQNGAIEKSQ